MKATVYSKYKNKQINYFYKYDFIGGDCGNTPVFMRTGSEVELKGKDKDGKSFKVNKIPLVPYFDFHGIVFMQEDYDLNFVNNNKLWRD